MGGWVGGWVGGIPLVELQNPRLPFHAFSKILFQYSRFSRSDKTDLKDCSALVFEFFRSQRIISPANHRGTVFECF